jgi:hypothetical protein
MATISFTQNLKRHLSVPRAEVQGETVRDALESVFEENPILRSYIVDDQGRLRKHVVVFIDGEMIEDREGLSDAIRSASDLVVMQALSGG